MEWTADEVLKIQKIMYETNAVSLNAIIDNDESDHNDDTNLMEMLPVDQISVEDEVLKTDGNKYLLEFLEKLSPREQLVLRMRFGIDDGVPKTLEEVGQHFHVTRERARQVEAKALRRLRSIIKNRHLSFDDFR